MPRYLFHLSFGQRVVPDEEGVELPNRSAARHEALAIVRDLANPEIGGNLRRWAGWFLEVADDCGRFFRTPIGHPALEIVTPDRLERGGDEGEPLQPAAAASVPIGLTARAAELMQERAARHAERVRLLKTNQRLNEELLSLCRASEAMRVRTSRLLAASRGGPS
jgi:hypothetical protein